MDHSYPVALPFHPLPPEITSTGARIVSFLHSGGRAVVLVGARDAGKTSTLDAVLVGMPAWVERVSNRIPQPLTLSRILAQIGAHGGPAIDAALDVDLGATLLRTLTERASPAQPVVLAIDDAHTLTQDALAALARIPGAGGPDQPGMVLLLAGEPALLGLLRSAGLARLRGAATLTLEMPARPGGAGAPEPGFAEDVSRRWPYMAVAAGVILLAAALLLRPAPAPILVRVPDPPALVRLAPTSVPDTVPAAREPEAAPAAVPPQVAPAPPPSGAVAEPQPDPMPTLDTAPHLPVQPDAAPEPGVVRPPAASSKATPTEAQLRHDFDVFLNRAGRDTAQLTPAAREGLFREYLQWRSRPTP